VAQALWAGKLFHIDLNAQRIGRYDQDFRFGAVGIRETFFLVKLLEDAEWKGMRHFDAKAYRVEDEKGVWEFARGCMRTYLILKEKARQFREDPEIQQALAAAGVSRLSEPTLGSRVSGRAIDRLRKETFNLDELAAHGCGHERLDQLVSEILLGVHNTERD
jgi:xylose isomerase